MKKTLEDASPQLCGADEEIWIGFIKRDIPDWEEKILYPRNPKSWWKVYRKLTEDVEKEAQQDAAALKAKFSRIKQEKDKNKLQQLEEIRPIPKLDGMEFAHAAEYNKVKKRPKDTRPLTTTLSFCAGSKTKVLTGKGVMAKAQREAREMMRFTSKSPLSTPTHQLKNAASKVLAVPRERIEDFRQAAKPKPLDPTAPKPAMFVPPARRIERNPDQSAPPPGMMTREERERRLRALTMPGRVAVAPMTSEPQISSSTSQSATKAPPISSASTMSSSPAKSTTTIDRKLPPTQPIPYPSAPKRKAEDSSIAPSIESPEARPIPYSTAPKRKAEDLSIAPSIETPEARPIFRGNSSSPSPRVLRRLTTPEIVSRLPKKKPSIFIPAKRRRVS